MNLKSEIAEIRDLLLAGAFSNEAAVSRGVLMRLLQALDWPIFDPQIVCPEFGVEGRRVDYALCHPAKKPAVFVEVKQVGNADGAERQLFEYAFHEGVPMVVLTDGQEWHFFLPAGQGAYNERRVYKLDLIARTPHDSAEKLERYLNYTKVCSGRAMENAQADYKAVRKSREIERTYPVAWRELITEPDELLVELFCERVESLCGFRPEVGDAVSFLRGKNTDLLPVEPKQKPSKGPRPPGAGAGGKVKPAFELFGEAYSARSAMEVVIEVFKRLHQKDPQFLEKYSQRKHGRKRRYISKNKGDLYPDRPDLQDYSRQLPDGWWIGTNFANRDKKKMLEIACDMSNIKFGKDLVVNF